MINGGIVPAEVRAVTRRKVVPIAYDGSGHGCVGRAVARDASRASLAV
jgi:hypothetical protein